MGRFSEGLRVVVLDSDNVAKRGVIKTAVEAIETALIQLDDGDIIKANFSRIGYDTPEPVEDPETEEETESDGITVTHNEFRKIAVDILKQRAKDSLLVELALCVFVAELEVKLFGAEK